MSEEKHKVHGISYVLYYLVLFFAYWFGSHRFDMDGDGDFDPEDVQAYLADHGFLRKNYKRPPPKARPKAKTKPKKQVEKPAADGVAPQPSIMDRDGDGEVTLNDILESKVDGPLSVEQEIEKNLKQRAPWFIIGQCTLCFVLWLAFAIKISIQHGGDPLQTKAGIDSFSPGTMDLRLFGRSCEDYRAHVWRWFTYQWTHVGAMHVLMNMFLNIMLGVPLEGLHGPYRMAIMFNFGVFGGACLYMWNDAHTAVVGCSGGCYSLIGLHFADLIMNWRQKKFRLPTVLLIFLLVGVDVLSYAMSLSPENASHSAHVGGAFAGLIIGVLIGKNLKLTRCEKVFMFCVGLVGIGYVVFSLAWMGVHEAPINIWEAGEGKPAWCWVRQMYNATISETKWMCIRCGTKSCMDTWGQQRYLADVSSSVCTKQGWYYDGR